MAKKPKVQEEKVPRAQDPNFVTLYTNSIGIMTSPSDIQLLFSQIQARGEAKIIIDRGIVSMSPQQAKLLNKLLFDTLQQWETTHGEIKIPLLPPK